MFSTRSIRFGGYAIARTVFFLFVTRLGRSILGVILLLIGIWYGMQSHIVTYQAGPDGPAKVFVSSDGMDYVSFPTSSRIYLIKAVDFSPYPDPFLISNLHAVSQMVYKSDSPQHVHVTQGDGTDLVVDEYSVVHFAFQDDKGVDQGSYSASEYSLHPANYYDNRWPIASILLGLGVFFLLLGTLIPYVVDKIVWREKSTNSFQG